MSLFHVFPGSGGGYFTRDAGVEGLVCAFKRGLTMPLRVGIVMYPQYRVDLLLLTEGVHICVAKFVDGGVFGNL